MNDAARRREMRNAGLATMDGRARRASPPISPPRLKEEKAPLKSCAISRLGLRENVGPVAARFAASRSGRTARSGS